MISKDRMDYMSDLIVKTVEDIKNLNSVNVTENKSKIELNDFVADLMSISTSISSFAANVVLDTSESNKEEVIERFIQNIRNNMIECIREDKTLEVLNGELSDINLETLH